MTVIAPAEDEASCYLDLGPDHGGCLPLQPGQHQDPRVVDEGVHPGPGNPDHLLHPGPQHPDALLARHVKASDHYEPTGARPVLLEAGGPGLAVPGVTRGHHHHPPPVTPVRQTEAQPGVTACDHHRPLPPPAGI